jgi:hypothetical protein
MTTYLLTAPCMKDGDTITLIDEKGRKTTLYFKRYGYNGEIEFYE